MSMIYAIENITLESSVIKLADGTLINADKIEFIRKFRRTLLSFLIGDQLSNNQRKGKYLFEGKWHSVESLARAEQELAASNRKEDAVKLLALEDILTHAKADFILQSA